MPAKKKDVKTGLCKKGFVEDRKTTHEYYRYVAEDGTRTEILTHFSHGGGGEEIPDYILGKIAKQCRLNRSQLGRFVDCRMTVKQYEKHLAKRVRQTAG